MTAELDYALKGRGFGYLRDAAILSYLQVWHKAVTRLDHKTNPSMNQILKTYLYDNIQLYLYPGKYSSRDVQK